MLSDYYQNLSVISVNTEPLRNYYIPYASKEEAKQELERKKRASLSISMVHGIFSIILLSNSYRKIFFKRPLLKAMIEFLFLEFGKQRDLTYLSISMYLIQFLLIRLMYLMIPLVVYIGVSFKLSKQMHAFT